MEQHPITKLLAEFRANRQALQRRLPAPPDQRAAREGPGGRDVRDTLVCIAAWLDEANDRIPRLLAGAPDRTYDAGVFNAAAVARTRGWTLEQALGAFRRVADRFEAIIEDSDPDEIADSPEAVAWLTAMTRALSSEQVTDVDPLLESTPAAAFPARDGVPELCQHSSGLLIHGK